METLDNTEWDVLIVGTGLQQSLLALYVPCPLAPQHAI
jgi:RAB protein geranylgeranyltransferase component A